MRLYHFHSSSASYRARIALNLKQLPVEYQSVGLRDHEQHRPEYVAVNPQRLVPALVDEGLLVAQSIAIFEYLDEKYPEPPLLPRDLAGRVRVRSLALFIACDIHPLNNSRVLEYLSGPAALGRDAVHAWRSHWITVGFEALEKQLAGGAGRFCHGDTPTAADCCLVPQVYKAVQSHVDLRPYPLIRRINDECLALPAFADAHPDRFAGAAS